MKRSDELAAAYQVCKDDEEFSTPYISLAEHEALIRKATIQVTTEPEGTTAPPRLNAGEEGPGQVDRPSNLAPPPYAVETSSKVTIEEAREKVFAELSKMSPEEFRAEIDKHADEVYKLDLHISSPIIDAFKAGYEAGAKDAMVSAVVDAIDEDTRAPNRVLLPYLRLSRTESVGRTREIL